MSNADISVYFRFRDKNENYEGVKSIRGLRARTTHTLYYQVVF